MKIFFAEQDPQKVVQKIQQVMGGRKLASMVSFALKGSQMEITIAKLGTSHLNFDIAKADKGLAFNLSSEKIAFSHRAFRGEVTEKIMQVIEQAGGVVEA